MLGTVFFSLVRNSILHGYITGIYIASGVILCDIIFIVLAVLSTKFADFLKDYKNEISLAGGIILVIMGLFMYLSAKAQKGEGKLFNSGNKWTYVGNGFLLNVINPVNFFSWLSINTYLTIEYNYSLGVKAVFFIACLSAIFLSEFLIAYFASKLQKMMKQGFLIRINQVSGAIFFFFGLKLLYDSISILL